MLILDINIEICLCFNLLKMSSNKKHLCVECNKSWVRKTDFESHFSLLQVKEGGRLVPNPCYNRKRKQSGIFQNVDNLKKNKLLNDYGFSGGASSSTVIDSVETLTVNLTEDREVEETCDSNSKSSLEFNQKLNNVNEKLDDVLTAIKGVPEKVKALIQSETKHANSQPSGNNRSSEEDTKDNEFAMLINNIKVATSMKSIKENKLIKNIFSIYKREDDDTEIMKCELCDKWSNSNSEQKLGIQLLEGSNYSVFDYEQGVKKAISKSFSNFKIILIKHIESQTHNKSLKHNHDFDTKNKRTKDAVSHSMRQMAYFTIKCNLSFNQFENYCATNFSCGLEIGNINHSRRFILTFLDLVSEKLVKKTADWFSEQKYVTITLDIGTENGIPLLAVLFISDKKSKLVDIVPITSKKGKHIATVCFEACHMKGNITDEQLKEKVVGVTGDGAFSKGNAPFKDQMNSLFEKALTIRWDMLHLINRAHIDAKGGEVEIFEIENESSEDIDNDIESPPEECADLISELINYIQNDAKKLRHGIKYTSMVDATLGSFKRPKVWSTTRMVVYEFEMLERFLENSIFLDIPIKFILLAKSQCLVMFALKYLLKNVQRIDITPAYINTVITKEAGKAAMQLACQVAVDVYSGKDISYLDQPNMESDICFDREITFSNILKTYVTNKKDLYVKNEEPHERNTRTQENDCFTISSAQAASDFYITQLWKAIRKRCAFTDLSDSPCAFSEAPAEGIFSVYGYVSERRERLTVENAVRLTRLALHGPPPATEESATLAKEAMENYPSKYGERFCTVQWRKGMTSNTVKKVIEKKWDW